MYVFETQKMLKKEMEMSENVHTAKMCAYRPECVFSVCVLL